MYGLSWHMEVNTEMHQPILLKFYQKGKVNQWLSRFYLLSLPQLKYRMMKRIRK
jgi:hypothetical protein